MIKQIILGLAALAFASIAHASGTVPGFSLTPQFDNFGKVMPGCRLFVIQAGTTATPQNAFQDTGLTTALPNPITCDASGRLPQWFVADGLIKLRLTDKNLSQVFVGDNLLVVGPSGGGGGGGGTIDPTTIAATGDIKASFTVSTLSGWVRMNGNTIGSATSGASERANADCQPLFVALWNQGNAVPGGRGASAAADWAANKTIVLPDLRGSVPAGGDAMGGADSGRLGGSPLASCRFTPGCSGGEATHQLTSNELPDLASTTVSTFSLSSTSTVNNIVTGSPVTINIAGASSPIIAFASGNPPSAVQITSTATVPRINSVTNSTSGSAFGAGHNNMQPTMLVTYFIKL